VVSIGLGTDSRRDLTSRSQFSTEDDIDHCGQTITEAIAGTFDIPLQDAEMLKFRLVDPTLTTQFPKSGEAAVRAIVAAKSKVRWQFFSSLPEREPIQRIVADVVAAHALPVCWTS